MMPDARRGRRVGGDCLESTGRPGTLISVNAFLLRLVLSVALIFQGHAAACASIEMAADRVQSATPAAEDGTDVAAGPGMQHADADGCSDCPGCPDGHQSGSDCGTDCGMIAALPALPAPAQHLVPVEAVVFTAKPSLVDFLQVPPTPPPIA